MKHRNVPSVVLVGVAFAYLLPSLAKSQSLPAFPGADGAAIYSSGGRDLGSGQIVYHVTKLNSAIDDSARFDFGTLRYGLNNNNFSAGVPRTIVFDVGGVFHLGRSDGLGEDPPWLTNGNGWDAQSRLSIGGTNVTLAGQTAPGGGVIFMGGGLKPQGSNNIIRNVTVASGFGMRNWWDKGDPFPDNPTPTPSSLGPGIYPDATVYDGMDISGTNLMIDHVSTLFATDETISMNENADNITIQYSNISQGLNYPQWDAEGGGFTGHALGSLLEAGSDAAISFHHNLYAHQKSRVPQTQGGEASYDFRNNVFYNWLGTAGNRRGSTRLNLVGNFYLSGNGGDNPVGGANTAIGSANGGTSVVSGSGSVHRDGNLLDSNKDGDPDDGAVVAGGASSPLWSSKGDTYFGATLDAREAFDRVLDYVGANWWRRDDVVDTPDERIVQETRAGTGKIQAWADDPWNDDPNEGQQWRDLWNTTPTSRNAGWDIESDIGFGVGDGMPTAWELKHGLDPNARDDAGDFDLDGYTNLEEYLNEIAAWPAPGPIVFNNAHGDGRFAHILNWDANPQADSVHPWQPSRFDTAVIDNGAVTIDAVGQYAGNVLIATGSGDNATLHIESGWLEINDHEHGLSDGMLVIGDNPAATATLNLSGGRLAVGTILKGAGGAFSFTGGTLQADTVDFDLEVDGGTLSPGHATEQLVVGGDLTINAGELAISIASDTNLSEVIVFGDATLGGELLVSLESDYLPDASDSFEVLSALSLEGAFNNLVDSRLNLPGGGSFLVSIGASSVVLSDFAAAIPGDFNRDGAVNAADYTVWRNGLGDQYDSDDYMTWRDNYGATLASTGIGESVPEPAALGVLLSILAAGLGIRRRL